MRGDGDEGQAAVELALVLPLVAVLLLAVVQVALVGRDQILVVQAAREAAREAVVDPRPASIRSAARRASGLKSDRLTTERGEWGGSTDSVTIVVRYRSPTDVVLIGPLLPDVEVLAKTTMRVESGRPAEQ